MKNFQFSIILQFVFLFILSLGFLSEISPSEFTWISFFSDKITNIFVLFSIIFISLFGISRKEKFFEKFFFNIPLLMLLLLGLLLSITSSISWLILILVSIGLWCLAYLGIIVSSRHKLLGVLLSVFVAIGDFSVFIDYVYFGITKNHIRVAHLFPIIIGAIKTWDPKLILYVTGITSYQMLMLVFIFVLFLAFPFLISKFIKNRFDIKFIPQKAFTIGLIFIALLFIYKPLVCLLPLDNVITWYCGTKLLGISDMPQLADMTEPYNHQENVMRVDRTRILDRSSYNWVDDSAPKKNIVFITIESWRRDAFEYMPFLSSLASKSLFLSNHYTPSNDSLGGTTAFYYSAFPPYIAKVDDSHINGFDMVSKMPSYIGIDRYAAFLTPSNWITFLKKSGYKLVRVLDSITLSYPEYFAKPTNEARNELSLPASSFNGGYSEDALEVLMAYMKKPGLKILETVLYDTHYNYTFPKEYEIYKPIVNYNVDLFANYDDEKMTGMKNRYKNSSCYIDSKLKIFFEKIEKENLMKDSVFIILGDHGECLGEDGFFFHASGAHENQFKTNAIIYGEDVIPQKIERITTHEDIIPTMAKYAGFSCNNVFGEDALTSDRKFIISYDITKDQHIIIRHNNYMNVFRLMNDGTLKWKNISRNNYMIDNEIMEMLYEEKHETLNKIVARDCQLIVDYFNKNR